MGLEQTISRRGLFGIPCANDSANLEISYIQSDCDWLKARVYNSGPGNMKDGADFEVKKDGWLLQSGGFGALQKGQEAFITQAVNDGTGTYSVGVRQKYCNSWSGLDTYIDCIKECKGTIEGWITENGKGVPNVEVNLYRKEQREDGSRVWNKFKDTVRTLPYPKETGMYRFEGVDIFVFNGQPANTEFYIDAPGFGQFWGTTLGWCDQYQPNQNINRITAPISPTATITLVSPAPIVPTVPCSPCAATATALAAAAVPTQFPVAALPKTGEFATNAQQPADLTVPSLAGIAALGVGGLVVWRYNRMRQQ